MVPGKVQKNLRGASLGVHVKKFIFYSKCNEKPLVGFKQESNKIKAEDISRKENNINLALD